MFAEAIPMQHIAVTAFHQWDVASLISRYTISSAAILQLKDGISIEDAATISSLSYASFDNDQRQLLHLCRCLLTHKGKMNENNNHQ
jgi:hypothetical protein